MRFTLQHVGEVEVPDRITVRAARSGLAAITGIGALGTAALSIDGLLLDDGQLAGAEPWVPGSVLQVGRPGGPVAPDPARQALRTDWHLAVVAGPATGMVA
uniref:hypothetical protein n=1 Tax=Actinotalea sp. TaxID=1872145 RepID=UPI0035639BF8